MTTDTEMTVADIFAHLISWRWQRNAALAILIVGTLVDIFTFQFSLSLEYWMVVLKALAAAIVMLNVGWTILKTFMMFPELALWISIGSMFDN